MRQGTPGHGQDMRELHRDLVKANDQKIRQIVAVLDDVVNPVANQAVLDPIRARLATLKPARPLRFARLLGIPVDPLIVPARDWRPGDATIPRTALASMARVVRSRLGSEAAPIEAIIEGHKTDVVQAITSAGDLLWPRAAEILAVAVAPGDWAETGLRQSVFIDLAHIVAGEERERGKRRGERRREREREERGETILRRAPQLRRLARQSAIGALVPDEQIVSDLLANIANEPTVAGAMIIRLILTQSPHALPVLWQIVASSRDTAEKSLLRQAIASATDDVVTSMESGPHINEEIGRGSLAEAADGVRRAITLLAELESEANAARHRPRLRAIRERLDEVCRARFATGMREHLVAPLVDAGAAVDREGQILLEAAARDLRTLETAARKVGGQDSYDQMLPVAAEVVRAAAEVGTLTPMRMLRLIEILAGSDVAEAYYQPGAGG